MNKYIGIIVITLFIILSIINIILICNSCDKTEIESITNILIEYNAASLTAENFEVECTTSDNYIILPATLSSGTYIANHYVINDIWKINTSSNLITLRAKGLINLNISAIEINDKSVEFEQKCINDTDIVIELTINQ